MDPRRSRPNEPSGDETAGHERATTRASAMTEERESRAESEATDDAQRGSDDASEIAALEERLLRALADLDNVRKRGQRELVNERVAERSRVTSEWLPIVDNLERALGHAAADPDALIEGLRRVHEQALEVLERLGFPRFEDLGEQFDPRRHEAVGAIDSDASKGTVVAIARPGYGTDESILRPAGVIVAKGPG